MNTKAIERIKGYCCEVTQEQWKELVRTADEVGVEVYGKDFDDRFPFFASDYDGNKLVEYTRRKGNLIPFPDFLAKLRGVEEWQPKVGEYVNGSMNGKSWSETEDEYIAYYCGKHVTKHMTVRDEWIACVWDYVRPLRPTITREEAEKQLGKRIIN